MCFCRWYQQRFLQINWWIWEKERRQNDSKYLMLLFERECQGRKDFGRHGRRDWWLLLHVLSLRCILDTQEEMLSREVDIRSQSSRNRLKLDTKRGVGSGSWGRFAVEKALWRQWLWLFYLPLCTQHDQTFIMCLMSKLIHSCWTIAWWMCFSAEQNH